MQEQVSLIALDLLHESPFNPRRAFNEAALQELAETMKPPAGRVEQPIVVRPAQLRPLLTDVDTFSDFEIVFGHRRFRAAQLAGLEKIPAIVRAMSDEEVKRAQIIENLQRADVHPIEEAEGFQAMIYEHNKTADLLAEEFGKSRSYVYGRLSLLKLCPSVRQACLEGKIITEVALLIGRLRHPKLQEKALQFVAGRNVKVEDGGKESFRRIRSMLNERFTLDLKDAMFDPEEEMLLPSAGNCIRCPKRSGNAPEYQDIAEGSKPGPYSQMKLGPNVCTDPDCFDAKKKALLKRQAEALAAEGKTVIEGNKARAAIDAYGNLKADFMPLAKVRAELKKAKDKPVTTLHIQDPRTGKVVQAVKRADLVAAGVVKQEEPKASGRPGSGRDDWRKEQAESEAKAKAGTEANVRLLGAVRAAMVGQPLGLDELRMVTHRALHDTIGSDAEETLEQLYGLDVYRLDEQLPTMSAGELAQLLIDCALVMGVELRPYDKPEAPQQLLDAAARLGIDAQAVLAGEPAPTPSMAARAQGGAAAGAKKGKKRPPRVAGDPGAPANAGLFEEEEQKVDAGCAGGSDAQADAAAQEQVPA